MPCGVMFSDVSGDISLGGWRRYWKMLAYKRCYDL